ncbi:MAG TPA: peptidoglycan DD-metalloendopeptidase family protein [Roseiflexaceae bacterium]|nr:peptidoglycan DD-metalloendopeptidase family protein [Roseiflexaceae bacterium]
MTNIRSLRLSRGLTLIDLALLTDIPARTLAEIEYGVQRLDYESRSRLASIFGVPAEQLCAGTAPRATHRTAWPTRAAPLLVAALLGALLLSDPLLNQLPPRSAAARAGSTSGPALAAVQRAAIIGPPTATAVVTPSPTAASAAAKDTSGLAAAAAAPSPTQPPTPRYVLAEDGPHGCPLAPEAGRVVMTQGYGVGTHEPAGVWGAIDLAIDGDGDGNAEPDTSRGVQVLATHAGVAHVFLDSWPAGNYVRVADDQSGWSSAYAHLDSVFVAEGQAILAGAPIGTVGSTGQTSGPHLHYEVWRGGENVDPTWLAECEG